MCIQIQSLYGIIEEYLFTKRMFSLNSWWPHTRSGSRRPLVTFQAWLRSRSRTSPSSSVKGPQDASSMFVSHPSPTSTVSKSLVYSFVTIRLLITFSPILKSVFNIHQKSHTEPRYMYLHLHLLCLKCYTLKTGQPLVFELGITFYHYKFEILRIL